LNKVFLILLFLNFVLAASNFAVNLNVSAIPKVKVVWTDGWMNE
jgi:hypothetical protein